MHHRFLGIASLFVWGMVVLPAQPKVEYLRNAAGFTIAGTPFYGIAQGSVFAVAGTGLGPEEPMTHNLDEGPLTTSMNGVSIQIAIVGTPGSTPALIYSVSSNTVLAILPSSTPLGEGSASITIEGRSASVPIKVVAGAFGIATVDGTGVGTAIARYRENPDNAVSFASAARSGETIVLEGTGLGADPNSDETNWIENPTNLDSGAAFEVYFGKIKAEVLYRGRTRRPGWDRVEVVVPEGITGCYVSVYAKTGTYVSNFTSVPVAEAGGEGDSSRACLEQGFGSPGADELLAKETISAGWLYLGQFSTSLPAIGPIPASTTISDSANAGFIRYTPFMFSNYGGRGDPGFGSCIVTNSLGQSAIRPQAVKYLDAGPFITLTPPNGANVRLLKESPVPSYVYSSAPPQRPSFIPKEGGTFKFSTDGGEDVGPLEASIKTNGAFTWTNRGNLTNINRSSDVEIRWTGGDEDTYMIIYGVSSTLTDPPLITSFNCAEKTSAGKFTIPRDVLSSMVQSSASPGPFSIPSGQLAVVNYKYPAKFTAPGLDVGNISYYFWDGTLVNYQ